MNTEEPKRPSMVELVEAMHEEYRKSNPYVTSLDQVVYDQRRDKWRAIICAGHELEDLRLVLKFLNQQVDFAGWNVSVLGFKRLIGDVDNFRNHLSLAKLWQARILMDKPNPITKVMRAFRRVDSEDKAPEPKTPKHLIPALAKSWAEELRKRL